MKNIWDHIRVWFHNSETIAWARLQLIVGAVWAVLSVSDLSGVLPAKWLPFWLIASGIITEYVRRLKEPHDLGVKTVADLSTVTMPITKADAVSVDQTTGVVTITPPVPAVPVGVVNKAAGE